MAAANPLRRVLTAGAGMASAALLGYVAGSGGGGSFSRGGAVAAAGVGPNSSGGLLPTPTTATRLPQPSATAPAAGAEQLARQILRFGAPTAEGVKFFDDFVLAYDRRLRLPVWVFERLTPDSIGGGGGAGKAVIDRSDFEFYEDLGQHPYFRSASADFAGSGYDRGHMAAAGNHKSSRPACMQTFILSNICPQVGPGFNRNLWNSLERYIRSLTRHYSAVYVCTGPLFLPSQQQAPGSRRRFVHYEVLGNNSVAVPTHFFKAVLLETASQQYELLSYVVPNMAHPVEPEPSLDLFLVPLDAIERAAGFIIFDQLPRSRLTRINKRPA